MYISKCVNYLFPSYPLGFIICVKLDSYLHTHLKCQEHWGTVPFPLNYEDQPGSLLMEWELSAQGAVCPVTLMWTFWNAPYV